MSRASHGSSAVSSNRTEAVSGTGREQRL